MIKFNCFILFSDNLFDSLIEDRNDKSDSIPKSITKSINEIASDSGESLPPPVEVSKKPIAGNKRKLFKTTNTASKKAKSTSQDSDSDGAFKKKVYLF